MTMEKNIEMIQELFQTVKDYGKKKTLYFDLDGTAAEWRKAASLSDLYQKGYFRSLKPTEIASYAHTVAAESNMDTYALSAYFPDSYAYEEKNAWIDEYMPNIDHQHRIFVPCGVNKAAFVIEAFRRSLTRDDILIDDYTENLIGWQEAGGLAIKWLNGVNGYNQRFKGPRVATLKELHEIIFNQ